METLEIWNCRVGIPNLESERPRLGIWNLKSAFGILNRHLELGIGNLEFGIWNLES